MFDLLSKAARGFKFREIRRRAQKTVSECTVSALKNIYTNRKTRNKKKKNRLTEGEWKEIVKKTDEEVSSRHHS